MTSTPPLGQLLQSFFVEHLITVKGLRPASVRSYRDTIRLLLIFAAADKGCKITRLSTSDLTFDRVVGLKHPRFHAHLVTCDRCAFRPGVERSTRPRPPRVGCGPGGASAWRCCTS
jgi:hypothetical protein